MKRISGSTTRARAKPTLWRMPPESSLGKAFSKPSRPTRAMASRALRSLSALGRPRASRPRATFSRTVSQGKRAKLWKTMAMPSMGPSTRWPLKRTSPSSGGMRPARMRKSVLFPPPERPRRATISPSLTSRSTPWRTGLTTWPAV